MQCASKSIYRRCGEITCLIPLFPPQPTCSYSILTVCIRRACSCHPTCHLPHSFFYEASSVRPAPKAAEISAVRGLGCGKHWEKGLLPRHKMGSECRSTMKGGERGHSAQPRNCDHPWKVHRSSFGHLFTLGYQCLCKSTMGFGIGLA
jgi:hypothetical protein